MLPQHMFPDGVVEPVEGHLGERVADPCAGRSQDAVPPQQGRQGHAKKGLEAKEGEASCKNTRSQATAPLAGGSLLLQEPLHTLA